MTVKTLADISGDNAVHRLTSDSAPARWVALSATGGAARWGDSNVSSSRGASIPQNVTVMAPIDSSDPFDTYDVAQFYAYVPTGTTLSVSYGQR